MVMNVGVLVARNDSWVRTRGEVSIRTSIPNRVIAVLMSHHIYVRILLIQAEPFLALFLLSVRAELTDLSGAYLLRGQATTSLESNHLLLMTS